MAKFGTSARWIKRGLICATTFIIACAPHTQDKETPNFLIILADDLAFSDIAAYGGEIETPNLTKLADKGVTFTFFHTSPMCSPSRAMLLTGVDQHRTGYGTMAEFLSSNQAGKLGYEGYLNDRVVTIPTLLGQHGYRTYMSGKWHLGENVNPQDRGFDKSFVLVQGAGSHFDKKGYADFMPEVTYLRDGQEADLPDDFYSSDFYATELIDYIKTGKDKSEDPFFAYLAFSAPHWPLHAPNAEIEKYDGKYADGWEVLRQKRIQGLIDTAVISPDAASLERLSEMVKWDSLTEDEQSYAAKEMAVYAAMVDRLDYNIGRVFDALEDIGELDNTVVIFTSDNGPEAIDFTEKPIFAPATDWVAANFDNSLENLGSPTSYPFYGEDWAISGAAIHKWYKTIVSEGGIHAPFILSWPGTIDSGGKTRAFSSLVDIMPTILDMAEIEIDTLTLNEPFSGKTMLPYLKGEADYIYKGFDGQGFELFGHEAYIGGDWKIMRLREPYGTNQWALYNLAVDPSESQDVKDSHPEIFTELMDRYEAYKQVNRVILPDADFSMFPDND